MDLCRVQREALFITFFLVAVVLLSLSLGQASFSWEKLLHGDEQQWFLIFQLRLPRVVYGLLIGSLLAGAGLLFQSLFRNDLATPFTLGVASGASLGAALFFCGVVSLSAVSLAGSVIASFVGASLTVLIVYSLAQTRAGFSPPVLLLAGVVLNFTFGSLVLLVQFMADQTQVFQLSRWFMGSLAVVGYQKLVILCPVWVLFVFLALRLRDELCLMNMGYDLALSRGVDVKAVQRQIYFVVSLGVATVVALSGVISFIGIIVPYTLRLHMGSSNPNLLPLTLICGGGFLVLCDLVARVAAAPAELPVGVLTALLGGPFFLWVLFRKRGGQGV